MAAPGSTISSSAAPQSVSSVALPVPFSPFACPSSRNSPLHAFSMCPAMKQTAPQDSKATVVVIDDDVHILELAALILSRRGYQVFTAPTASAGMEIIAARLPELVLLDYMMPEMDGLSALHEIRTRFPDTYVVMFTGKGSEQIAVELMKG